jgi:hypothetical protein
LRSASARLLNIGRLGGFLTVESFPQGSPPSAIMVVLKVGPRALETEATVLEVREAPDGSYRLRVAFPRPCPAEFLQVAVQHRI